MQLLRRVFSATFAVMAALAGVAAAMPGAQAQVLRVGGTGSGMLLMQQLAEPFRSQTGIALQIIPSLGSAGGLRALAAGALDIAITGRPADAAEARTGIIAGATASTAFVLATSHPSPPSLAAREVAGIYRAMAATWPDGTPITLVMRPRAESDALLLAAAFPDMPAALDLARLRADLPVAAQDPDNAEMAERLAGSLATGSYSQFVGERRKLRFVAIDGVAPSIEALASGAYPYRKPYFFVHAGTPSAQVVRFMDFLRSDAGRNALRDAHCLLDEDK